MHIVLHQCSRVTRTIVPPFPAKTEFENGPDRKESVTKQHQSCCQRLCAVIKCCFERQNNASLQYNAAVQVVISDGGTSTPPKVLICGKHALSLLLSVSMKACYATENTIKCVSVKSTNCLQDLVF